MEPDWFLDKLTQWAKNTGISSLALIGSYARHEARANSDIDLILLTPERQVYINQRNWIEYFGQVKSYEIEDWGQVISIRVYYQDGPEAEFGFASPEWAEIPLDSGTKEVISGGIRILLDEEGILGRAFREATRE